MNMQTLLEKLKSIYLKGEGLPHDRIGPTVGLNIRRIEDANVKLVFWDLGGQPGLRTIWEKYYDEAHAIVYVIDSASSSTFEDAKSALEKVLRHEDLQEAPLLIFANKQDLPAAVREEELDRHLHLKEFDERPYMFVAGSAFDGPLWFYDLYGRTGIKLGIDWLVEEMGKGRRTEALRARTNTYAKI
ncbi:ADP-ribosylation factor-like protein 1 isoform X3 [Triticum dicoccoides]|uniref:ADP-ribosylation factor-like protein 1 isoform X3 n=1 Tax=Triticum dicoccoides TaxID=85692 RepID=UPI00188EAACD|nr:ADP-ribosylation factor-like protein 1 isoform X3 [Triticum dicoccoides]